MSDRDHRVREIAHRLWEEEGRPSDQEKRHWAAAERLFDAQATAGAGSDATGPHAEAQPASASGAGKRRAARKGAKRDSGEAHSGATH